MEKYEAIQDYIRRAQIERSVYLAELISKGIFGAWTGIRQAFNALAAVARARTRNNVFTFDA